MKTFEEIRNILHTHAGDLRRQYGIIDLSVFGSVVRGEARGDSDVDILATFGNPTGLLKLISAENYISEILGLKVDLIPSDEVRPELQEQIFREAVRV
jgi:predicted nucleotidyltransferase